MKKRTLSRIVGSTIFGVAGILVLAGANSSRLYSASQVTESVPVEIQSAIKRTATGHPEILLTVTNKGDKEVIALTLLTTYFDGDDKAAGRLTTNQIFGLEPRAVRKTLGPGEKWTPPKGLASPTNQNGVPARYEIGIDYVLFKDGSSWGADQLKQSLQIAGIRQGWALARSTLKGVLVKDGVNAVLEMLNQDTPNKE